MAVRSGAPKPDIGSVDAFIRSMLAAKSVAYPDPASGGASGIHFAHVLAQLGIDGEMRPKSKLVRDGASVGELVAEGEAEIGVQMISELSPVRGIDVIGPLPGSLRSTTSFSAGLGIRAGSAATAFIAFLASHAAERGLRAGGLEPR
jgi:molybdate transport system substrate-binding protein